MNTLNRECHEKDIKDNERDVTDTKIKFEVGKIRSRCQKRLHLMISHHSTILYFGVIRQFITSKLPIAASINLLGMGIYS